MIARSDGGVLNGRGANEADFGIVVVVGLREDDLGNCGRCLAWLLCFCYRRLAFVYSMSSPVVCTISVTSSAPTPIVRVAPASASATSMLRLVF